MSTGTTETGKTVARATCDVTTVARNDGGKTMVRVGTVLFVCKGTTDEEADKEFNTAVGSAPVYVLSICVTTQLSE